MAFLEQQQPMIGDHIGIRMAEPPVAFGRLGGKDEAIVEQIISLDLRILDGKRDQDQIEVAACLSSGPLQGRKIAVA